MGRAKRKVVFEHAQIAQIPIYPANMQSLIRAFALHWYMILLAARVGGDAQADLGHCCPHMFRRQGNRRKKLQSNLVISNSLILNYRLSRSENLIPVLTWYMSTGNKIMWKRGDIAPKEQFFLFSTLFYIYIFLTSGVKLRIHLLNMVVQFIVFLILSTLICRGTDISKCFSESLGIRDNESRL